MHPGAYVPPDPAEAPGSASWSRRQFLCTAAAGSAARAPSGARANAAEPKKRPRVAPVVPRSVAGREGAVFLHTRPRGRTTMQARRHVVGLVLAVGGVLLGCGMAGAGAWDRFRGPNGTGAAADTEVPVRWTAQE